MVSPNTPVTGPAALLVESDLFFAARILSVLQRQGYTAYRAAAPDEALQLAARVNPAVALVSLRANGPGSPQLIMRLKQTANPPRVLAYLNHTQIPEIRDAARLAGCDLLCPNSSVVGRLPTLLQRIMASSGGAMAEALETDAAQPAT